MLYLINGGPGIQNYQTMKATEPEAENEVPIAVVLSDVEESNPNDTTTQSLTSHITLEKFSTDADTDDDANASNLSRPVPIHIQLVNSGRVTHRRSTCCT